MLDKTMQKLRFIKYFMKPFSFCVALIFMANYAANYIHLTHNITPSLPLGYYLTFPWEINRGTYIICLDDSKKEYLEVMAQLGLQPNNQCKNGYLSIMKTIVGIPGDLVEITENGVSINSVIIPNSKAMKKYHSLSLLPIESGYQHTLSHDEYWVQGSIRNSYDSRYFGVITKDEIKNKAVMILQED